MEHPVTPPSFSLAKKGLAALGLFLAPYLVHGQTARVEESLFECIRSAFPGGGQSLEGLMASFEAELISEGLLEGPEGADYRGLLQRIASGQGVVRPADLYFGPRYRGLERDTTALKGCWESLPAPAQATDSVLLQFETFRERLLHESMEPPLEAASYLDLLTEADFELPYYRLFTYELIDRQAYNTEFAPAPFTSLEALGQLNSSGANVFRVYLNEEDQLIVADQVVSTQQMGALVAGHARTFEQSALYVLQVEADVKYGNFVGLKDQIALAVSRVRDTYARRTLGKTLTELDRQEREAVYEKYPIRIISP
jgi:hypothetical protein